MMASLPNDPALQEPQIAKADPNATPVLIVAVTDALMTQTALSGLIVNSLSDEFASVHGVGSLGVSGFSQRAIVVEPDEHKLAASGLTNRQVAAALFISPKTVESNLARAYRKLDIRSRAELGAHVAANPPDQT